MQSPRGPDPRIVALRQIANAIILCAIVGACTTDNAQVAETDSSATADTLAPAVTSLVLIDSTIPPAVAGEGGWNFQQSLTRDLNADGSAERVVITARVEMYRGQPAWDDGQPWQVYIVDHNGKRTDLYSRRLQLGTLTMRVSRVDASGKASVILLEQLPDRMSVYEVSYLEPSRVNVVALVQRDLDATGDTARIGGG
jgi:hypothetical protein